MRTPILQIINWSYKPFRKFIPPETFRYAVCGGANTSFDIFLYFINYNFILQKKLVHLKFITISPHIAAFIMAFCITFPIGFFLSKYITFSHSELKGRVQLFRYGVTVLMCILLNYIFLKIFVEYLGWYPTISKIATTVIVVVYSYFSQKYFTFRTKVSTI
ncbi:MAG: GtrA family protein [Bacteroidales bacterium]|nr:GtrA family protein [Bacteroidales bacterium]